MDDWEDVLAIARDWRRQGLAVALATVTRTWGSAPRPVGSRLAVASDGRIAGSVSGGCVEAAVADLMAGVIAAGAPRVARFGVPNETAWSLGLACGGEIQVFIEPVA